MSARSVPSRLKVMNFLNEVAADYLEAISEGVERLVRYVAEREQGDDRSEVGLLLRTTPAPRNPS